MEVPKTFSRRVNKQPAVLLEHGYNTPAGAGVIV